MNYVNLRIVGIFFEAKVVFTPGDTIKQILDKAVASSRGALSYKASMTTPGKKSPATYSSLLGFKHTLKRDITSLSGSTRKKGVYELFESVSSNNGSTTVHAWQYYVIRGKKAASNASKGKASLMVSPVTPPANQRGFTDFDKMVLEEGDEIVWRNVSIVRNPQTAN
jgi:hypothetical protein